VTFTIKTGDVLKFFGNSRRRAKIEERDHVTNCLSLLRVRVLLERVGCGVLLELLNAATCYMNSTAVVWQFHWKRLAALFHLISRAVACDAREV
jgi:hypothetical protein